MWWLSCFSFGTNRTVPTSSNVTSMFPRKQLNSCEAWSKSHHILIWSINVWNVPFMSTSFSKKLSDVLLHIAENRSKGANSIVWNPRTSGWWINVLLVPIARNKQIPIWWSSQPNPQGAFCRQKNFRETIQLTGFCWAYENKSNATGKDQEIRTFITKGTTFLCRNLYFVSLITYSKAVRHFSWNGLSANRVKVSDFIRILRWLHCSIGVFCNIKRFFIVGIVTTAFQVISQ